MKKVRFNEKVEIKSMCVWSYAYREHRKSYWMTVAVDRMRFQRRIRNMEHLLNPILIRMYKNYKK